MKNLIRILELEFQHRIPQTHTVNDKRILEISERLFLLIKISKQILIPSIFYIYSIGIYLYFFSRKESNQVCSNEMLEKIEITYLDRTDKR